MGYASEVLQDTPLLYWRMNESSGTNIADSSGNSRVGTSQWNPTFAQTGPITTDSLAKSIQFHTTDPDSIQSAYAPFVAGSQRSYEFWAKKRIAGTVKIIDGDAGASNTILRINNNGDGPTYHMDWVPTNGGTIATWNYSWPDLTGFHHCVLTHDDASGTGFRKARLYVDSVDKGEVTSISAYGANAELFYLSNGSFDGWICEFAIYSGLLSAARVLAHYNAATIADAPLRLPILAVPKLRPLSTMAAIAANREWELTRLNANDLTPVADADPTMHPPLPTAIYAM